MRILISIFILFLLKTFSNANAQGTFKNLGFEEATFVSVGQFTVRSDLAMPGWTLFVNNSSQTTMYFDAFTLDSAAVSIHDSSSLFATPIQGQYSIVLQGGNVGGPAAIAQVGTIAANAQTLAFKSSLTAELDVYFDGQHLSLFNASTHPNYNIWAADISSFAGETGELRFSTSQFKTSLIDDITFSTLAVPEPSIFSIFVTGGLIFSAASRAIKRR